MWEVADLVVLLPVRGQVSDHGLPLTVHDLREIKVFVVLALLAVQAISPVLLERVGSPHGIDELASLPLPGEVPVVKAAEGAEVVNGDLGLVVVAIRGEHVVHHVEVAVLAGQELDRGNRLLLALGIFNAAHTHGSPCNFSMSDLNHIVGVQVQEADNLLV